MASERILVVGGTGGVASCVIDQLLQLSPPLPLRVAARDPSKLPSFPSFVEVVKGDVSDPSTYPLLFNNVTKVFLYMQGLQNTLQAVLTAAKDAGVRHIVFLSSVAVLIPDHPMGKIHIAIEEGIKNAGFTYTILRPNGFCTNVRQTLVPLINTQSVVALPFPHSHSVLIANEDTASLVVLAFSSSRLDNQTLNFTGPESLTNQQQLDILSQVREEKRGKKIEYKEASGEEWKEKVLETGLMKFPPAILDAVLANWKRTENVPQPVNNEVERITGKSTTFLQWARIHADQLFD